MCTLVRWSLCVWTDAAVVFGAGDACLRAYRRACIHPYKSAEKYTDLDIQLCCMYTCWYGWCVACILLQQSLVAPVILRHSWILCPQSSFPESHFLLHTSPFLPLHLPPSSDCLLRWHVIMLAHALRNKGVKLTGVQVALILTHVMATCTHVPV